MENLTSEGHFISVSILGNEARKLAEGDCKNLLPSVKAALKSLEVIQVGEDEQVLLVPACHLSEMKSLEQKVRDAVFDSLPAGDAMADKMKSCFAIGPYSVGKAAEEIPLHKFLPDDKLRANLLKAGVPLERIDSLFAEYAKIPAVPQTEVAQNEAAA